MLPDAVGFVQARELAMVMGVSFHRFLEPVEYDRFHQIVEGSAADRLLHRSDLAGGRDHDDIGAAVQLPDMAKKVQAACGRQVNIEKHELRLQNFKLNLGLCFVGSDSAYPEAGNLLQKPPVDLGDAQIVFDNQHFNRHVGLFLLFHDFNLPLFRMLRHRRYKDRSSGWLAAVSHHAPKPRHGLMHKIEADPPIVAFFGGDAFMKHRLAKPFRHARAIILAFDDEILAEIGQQQTDPPLLRRKAAACQHSFHRVVRKIADDRHEQAAVERLRHIPEAALGIESEIDLELPRMIELADQKPADNGIWNLAHDELHQILLHAGFGVNQLHGFLIRSQLDKPGDHIQPVGEFMRLGAQGVREQPDPRQLLRKAVQLRLVPEAGDRSGYLSLAVQQRHPVGDDILAAHLHFPVQLDLSAPHDFKQACIGKHLFYRSAGQILVLGHLKNIHGDAVGHRNPAFPVDGDDAFPDRFQNRFLLHVQRGDFLGLQSMDGAAHAAGDEDGAGCSEQKHEGAYGIDLVLVGIVDPVDLRSEEPDADDSDDLSVLSEDRRLAAERQPHGACRFGNNRFSLQNRSVVASDHRLADPVRDRMGEADSVAVADDDVFGFGFQADAFGDRLDDTARLGRQERLTYFRHDRQRLRDGQGPHADLLLHDAGYDIIERSPKRENEQGQERADDENQFGLQTHDEDSLRWLRPAFPGARERREQNEQNARNEFNSFYVLNVVGHAGGWYYESALYDRRSESIS
ncbi:hypothetical protein BN871_CV_00390 [Paenibacillus sp. P22]|nr:hypothetical protein BN871_CV_00390 [Paenibacillus sp. P22]